MLDDSNNGGLGKIFASTDPELPMVMSAKPLTFEGAEEVPAPNGKKDMELNVCCSYLKLNTQMENCLVVCQLNQFLLVVMEWSQVLPLDQMVREF
jgi:hypothetical protein